MLTNNGAYQDGLDAPQNISFFQENSMYPVTVRNSTVPFRNLMEEFFGESAWPEVFGETAIRRFSPALDLQEDETPYQLQVELPG